MYVSKKIRDFIEERKQHHGYWATRLKLDFAIQLHKRLSAININYAELAERIDSSRPYVSKVLNGESNLTIDSMVKLAHATGARIDVRLIDREAVSDPKLWFGKVYDRKKIGIAAPNTEDFVELEAA